MKIELIKTRGCSLSFLITNFTYSKLCIKISHIFSHVFGVSPKIVVGITKREIHYRILDIKVNGDKDGRR